MEKYLSTKKIIAAALALCILLAIIILIASRVLTYRIRSARAIHVDGFSEITITKYERSGLLEVPHVGSLVGFGSRRFYSMSSPDSRFNSMHVEMVEPVALLQIDGVNVIVGYDEREGWMVYHVDGFRSAKLSARSFLKAAAPFNLAEQSRQSDLEFCLHAWLAPDLERNRITLEEFIRAGGSK